MDSGASAAAAGAFKSSSPNRKRNFSGRTRTTSQTQDGAAGGGRTRRDSHRNRRDSERVRRDSDRAAVADDKRPSPNKGGGGKPRVAAPSGGAGENRSGRRPEAGEQDLKDRRFVTSAAGGHGAKVKGDKKVVATDGGKNVPKQASLPKV